MPLSRKAQARRGQRESRKRSGRRRTASQTATLIAGFLQCFGRAAQAATAGRTPPSDDSNAGRRAEPSLPGSAQPADAVHPGIRRVLGLADTDGDGALERAEFARLREVLGNAPGNAATAFDALDADGDGRVGREEYLSAIRAFVVDGTSPMYDALVTTR
ncbi:EF-hand domain-containing protein [Streptomyces sp. NPDC005180]|uniref:EF-hand domain-containing protein n=1 Tax=Streptomyces sp. NPDC005180 TaxID=3156868 RepID=UPI0033BE2E63